ncbi:hypothetical protein EJD97_020895 [Solanum chilense]|uniref:Uncharacterized protein n=1 Tax=Solanum chilense TaxID=4083 RepID=A0A6N2AYD6_SOLCI|nr:hypothetical protein EJD97_020895 [Solanum chilense]
MEVHQRLDAFELRVFTRPASIVDLTTLQDVVESLRAYMDAILEAWVPEFEATSAEPAKDTVMDALFSTTTPSPQPREHTKRHRSREDDETRSRKRDHIELEAARRSSLIDEEAQQMRAQEVAVGASSSRIAYVERSTTEGTIIAVYTTDGVLTTEGAGFEKLDPTSC